MNLTADQTNMLACLKRKGDAFYAVRLIVTPTPEEFRKVCKQAADTLESLIDLGLALDSQTITTAGRVVLEQQKAARTCHLP